MIYMAWALLGMMIEKSNFSGLKSFQKRDILLKKIYNDTQRFLYYPEILYYKYLWMESDEEKEFNRNQIKCLKITKQMSFC